MLTLAGFLIPYVVALAAFSLLSGRVAFPSLVSLGASLLIVSSPWFIPDEFPVLRFLASISAAMLTLKLIDVSLDLKRQRRVTWQEYEPPRFLRRLQLLRRWSHEEVEQVLT